MMVQITNDQVDDIEILEELPNSSFRELSNNQQVLSNNQYQPNETNQMATLDEMDDGGDGSVENEVENLSDDDDDNEEEE